MTGCQRLRQDSVLLSAGCCCQQAVLGIRTSAAVFVMSVVMGYVPVASQTGDARLSFLPL